MRVHRTPHGPRVYIGCWRIHHGLVGLVLLAAGVLLGDRWLVALGLTLIADDRADFPWALGE